MSSAAKAEVDVEEARTENVLLGMEQRMVGKLAILVQQENTNPSLEIRNAETAISPDSIVADLRQVFA